jgi:hypothetical protein
MLPATVEGWVLWLFIAVATGIVATLVLACACHAEGDVSDRVTRRGRLTGSSSVMAASRPALVEEVLDLHLPTSASHACAPPIEMPGLAPPGRPVPAPPPPG